MRNGQNKRMRGRNRNHKSHHGGGGGGGGGGGHHHNPLTRVYESNGPEVKIRGTAHHIAEKYLQLARDAQGSGDPVTAENHFQHAEHYLRMPPSSGIALGFDRLVMLTTGATRIEQVLWAPVAGDDR